MPNSTGNFTATYPSGEVINPADGMMLLLCLIAQYLGTEVQTGIPTQIVQPTVTPHISLIGASASGSIPTGAKGWTISFLTGTGSLGGAAVSAGFSDSDVNTLATALAYTTDGASSAFLRYNT